MLATVCTTRSIGRPSFFAVAAMMRMFAWCGTSQSMSAAVMPLASSAWSTVSPSFWTAVRKTSRPAICTKASPPSTPFRLFDTPCGTCSRSA